ncbi:MAG TPA: hypothetical protein VHJ20_18260 [Polyangia bacterium]|nr:hypothetical protein [Polyangia bacterium]
MSALPAVALLLTLAAARGAPSPEEARLFTEGLHALDAGDARGAERAWKQGYAVAHDPAFLVRIGEAEEKAGAPAEAADSYRQYLREAPDASDRADVEARIARLAPPKAPAAPEAPARDFGAPPATDLPATPAPGPGDEVRPGAVDAERARPEDDEGGWTRANITAWSATGATVLLLGTAGFFAAEAASHEGDLNRLTSFRDENGAPLPYTPDLAQKYQSAMTDGRHDAHVATVLLLAAAGTAAVACAAFVIDGVWPEHASAAPAVAIAPVTSGRGALGAWSWRF